jgi:hypothetical protein
MRVSGVIGSRMLQLGCIGLALNITAAHADRSLRLSTAHLVAESSTVIVMHDHDVKQVKGPGTDAGRRIALEHNSTLRIVRKSDNAEIFRQAVMPLTALTSVDDGRYFAGLSNLQTLSFQYNFLLVSAAGQIVTAALITPTSGHCRAVSATTTNFLRWFDETAPTVQLSFTGDQVAEVTVVNPYDRNADGSAGKCVTRVAGANSNEAALDQLEYE